jgi:hypothetical protein
MTWNPGCQGFIFVEGSTPLGEASRLRFSPVSTQGRRAGIARVLAPSDLGCRRMQCRFHCLQAFASFGVLRDYKEPCGAAVTSMRITPTASPRSLPEAGWSKGPAPAQMLSSKGAQSNTIPLVLRKTSLTPGRWLSRILPKPVRRRGIYPRECMCPATRGAHL